MFGVSFLKNLLTFRRPLTAHPPKSKRRVPVSVVTLIRKSLKQSSPSKSRHSNDTSIESPLIRISALVFTEPEVYAREWHPDGWRKIPITLIFPWAGNLSVTAWFRQLSLQHVRVATPDSVATRVSRAFRLAFGILNLNTAESEIGPPERVP